MPQFDRNSQRDNKSRGSEPNFNWRGVILIVIAFSLIAMAMLFYRGGMQPVEDVPYNVFPELWKTKQTVNDKNYPLQLVVEDGRPTQTLRGAYIRQGIGSAPAQPVPFRTTVYLTFTNNLQEKLAAAGIQPAIKTESNMLAQTVVGFLPIALFLLVLYFLFRQQIRMAGKGALNFGKSKARMLARDKNKITFRDVAGVEEAKDEVQELVEFLRDPKKFQKLGGRIPKGVLMVGPPGTGKTLLARAIAGEADVPFFSISGSDFVEMFVGVGASRVRDMFEQGKKSAPCIIFIDEIDAVGRHRGHGVGGGHDEREQTLNALLVEMDGFDTQEGVIIIAATNRPDVLDPALLRPRRDWPKHPEPLHKATITPRGPSLASTMWLPEEDKYPNRKAELLASLTVSMGGRVAEELAFGDVTNGARGDIKMATATARRMVCEWGMSEKLGMVEYGDHEDYVFLGRDISRARDYSEATAEEIDQEVRKLLDEAYQLAKKTLTANRDKLEVIAKALLEYETLDGSQIKEIVEHGRLINPPPGASPPPGKKMPAEKPPKQVVAAPDVTPPLPGALGGAPA